MIKIYCSNCKETFTVAIIRCPKCHSNLVKIISENFQDKAISKKE